MIFAGLALLAIGIADLIRQFWRAPRRWIPFAIATVVFLLFAAGLDALGWGIFAMLAAAAWAVSLPTGGSGRAGLWPVGILAAICAGAIAIAGPRETSTAWGPLWMLPGAVGGVPVDQAVLVVGSVTFLLESANVVVRTALRAEAVVPAGDAAGDPTQNATPGLKGGRLIGPLERILVFALTLASAYTLLAAVLAAKGIVRFPEISRDSDAGNRAEYFLVGSLVSWVLALAAAFLVWWGAAQGR